MVQDKVISMQVLEGGTDAVLFENFIYRTLNKLRQNAQTGSKHIVIIMDNASIHKHSSVFHTARKMKVSVLFNAEYSPWLNPVEQLFNYIKKELKQIVPRPPK